MKTQRMGFSVGLVFVAIAQSTLLLLLWGLSAVCDILIASVYWLGRFGMCDGAIWLLDKLCERGSAEMDIEDNDDQND